MTWQEKENQPNPNPEQKKPFIDNLIETSLKKFWEKEKHNLEEGWRAYFLSDAASETLSELWKTPEEAFFLLIRETSIKPGELGVPYGETWKDWLTKICVDILTEELRGRHPEAEREDQIRSGFDYEELQGRRVDNFNTGKDPFYAGTLVHQVLAEMGFDIQFEDAELTSMYHMTVDTMSARNKIRLILKELRKNDLYWIIDEAGDGHAYSLLAILDPKEDSYFLQSHPNLKEWPREKIESFFMTAFERSLPKVQRILYRGNNRPKQIKAYNNLVEQGSHSFTEDELKTMLHYSIEGIFERLPQSRPDAPPIREEVGIF